MRRTWPLALAGALFATALLVTAPTGLGRSWRAAEAGSRYLLHPWPLYAALLFLAAVLKPDLGRGSARLRAFALPVLGTTPALLLKTECANPTGWLVLEGLLAIVLVGLAGRELGRPKTAAALALVGLLAVTWAARAEKLRREREVADGRVELLLRELADAIGRDTAAHGSPPADSRAWLARLAVPGWQVTEHGDWYWAPAEGLAPGALRLRYSPPDASAADWAVVLRTVPQPLRGRDSRPFEAELTLDGAVAWSWPSGPPPAVAARLKAGGA